MGPEDRKPVIKEVCPPLAFPSSTPGQVAVMIYGFGEDGNIYSWDSNIAGWKLFKDPDKPKLPIRIQR